MDNKRSNPKESEQFFKDVFPPKTIYSLIQKLFNPDFKEPEYKSEPFNFKKIEKSDKKNLK